ncbi:MAG: hypothetical protein ACM33V_12905 [Chloroflexota bacterium]
MFNRVLIFAMLLLTACVPVNSPRNSAPSKAPAEQAVEAAATSSPAAEGKTSEVTAFPSPALEDGLQKKITQIVRRDLAVQLDISTEGISVISVESIVWPNAALGCPFPGEVYTEGTVPGFRIKLEAKNKEYSYHTDSAGQFVLCANQDPDLQDLPSFPVTPGEIDDGEPWVPVK